MTSSEERFVVVLAVDSSEHSTFTFNWYVRHVHKPHYKLHIVHVPDSWKDLHMGKSLNPASLHDLIQRTEEQTSQLEGMYIDACKRLGVSDSEFHILKDKEPWHAIVEYARTSSADTIVIGSRGQGTIKRTLMGSVSDSVLHHSPVPVIVCRKKE